MTDPSATTSLDAGGHSGRSFHPLSSRVSVDLAGVTHTGLLRESNEDQFYIAKLSRALETLSTSLPAGDVPERAEEVNYVMVVADGMGGHAAGEVASRTAVTALVGLALELPNWILKLDDQTTPEVERRARQAVEHIASVIYQQGQQNSALRGMGSTLTIVRSLGRHLLVGDSRAYLCRGGALHQLTKDHTYAQALIDQGALKTSDAEQSGLRHILTNALGGSSEHVDVDIDIVRLEDGDRVLLCSDGLTDLVDAATMRSCLSTHAASKAACEVLLKAALDRGGRDNITVVIAGYGFPADSADCKVQNAK
jgi:protein phosphatase